MEAVFDRTLPQKIAPIDRYIVEDFVREAAQDPRNEWAVRLVSKRQGPPVSAKVVAQPDATRTDYPYEQLKKRFPSLQQLRQLRQRLAMQAQHRRIALEALNQEIRVQVTKGITWRDVINDPFHEPRYYLDLAEQQAYDSLLDSPQPGSIYYPIARDGTIDLNHPEREPQQAQLVPLNRLIQALQLATRMQAAVRFTPTLLRDAELIRVLKPGDYYIRANATIGSGTPSAALAKEATTGVLEAKPNASGYQNHLEKTAIFRDTLLKIYQTRTLNEYEKCYLFYLYNEATEVLRFTYSDSSLFPFHLVSNQSRLEVLKRMERVPKL